MLLNEYRAERSKSAEDVSTVVLCPPSTLDNYASDLAKTTVAWPIENRTGQSETVLIVAWPMESDIQIESDSCFPKQWQRLQAVSSDTSYGYNGVLQLLKVSYRKTQNWWINFQLLHY